MNEKLFKHGIWFFFVVSIGVMVISSVGTKQRQGETSTAVMTKLCEWINTPLHVLYEYDKNDFIRDRAFFSANQLFYQLYLPAWFEEGESVDKDFVDLSEYQEYMLMEGKDENDRKIAAEGLEYNTDAVHLTGKMYEQFQKENQIEEALQEIAENIVDEQNTNDSASDWFVPQSEKVYSYNKEDLQSFEAVVKAFFAIDQNTRAYKEELNLSQLMNPVISPVQRNGEGVFWECSSLEELDTLGDIRPDILIYHTHASEAFVDSNEMGNKTIRDAGTVLGNLLAAHYGYRVLHYCQRFDEDRDYAYANALPCLEALHEKLPGIVLAIDLHRDEMSQDRHLVTTLQGKECAQYMFFCGMSRNRSTGELESLENVHRQDNLNLAFQLQLMSNEYYPGLARRIYLKAYRYNLHLWPGNVLIELGAQNNTVQEIFHACEPLAHVFDLVLSGKAGQELSN